MVSKSEAEQRQDRMHEQAGTRAMNPFSLQEAENTHRTGVLPEDLWIACTVCKMQRLPSFNV